MCSALLMWGLLETFLKKLFEACCYSISFPQWYKNNPLTFLCPVFLWCTKEVNCDSVIGTNFLIGLSWATTNKQLETGRKSEWKWFLSRCYSRGFSEITSGYSRAERLWWMAKNLCSPSTSSTLDRRQRNGCELVMWVTDVTWEQHGNSQHFCKTGQLVLATNKNVTFCLSSESPLVYICKQCVCVLCLDK